MERIDCLKALVPYIKDQLVVITLGRTALEWAEVCPREGNLFNSGMGNHIPVALGLAKALPHRQIILLDSDGSVLMLLPALTTLGSFPAPNLKIFVFDNEADTSRVADIAAMAQGAGVRGATTVRDLDQFNAAARGALASEGMAFVVAKVELSKGPAPRKDVGHKEGLLRFVRYVEKTENIAVLHREHN